MLFNDFGVQHFHLGLTIASSGFVERTDHVLLARITGDSAYFVDVVKHPVGGEAWAQCRALNIVHSNWPETLERCRAHGVSASDEPTTDQFVATLRGKRLGYLFVATDGVAYCSPGGAYFASGLSWEAGTRCDRWVTALVAIEKQLPHHEARIREAAAQREISLGESISVVLNDFLEDGALLSSVAGTGLQLVLGKLPR